MEITPSFATQAYIEEGWLGLVSLRADKADYSRVTSGQVRYHTDHDWSNPVGMVNEVWFDPEPKPDGRFMCKVDIKEIPSTETFRQQRDAGLRGDTSVGYRITDLYLSELGDTWMEDKLDAAWTLLEVSDVTVPADVNSGEGRQSDSFNRSIGYDPDADRLVRIHGSVGVISRSLVDKLDAERKAKREELESKRSAESREQTPAKPENKSEGRTMTTKQKRTKEEVLADLRRELTPEERDELLDELEDVVSDYTVMPSAENENGEKPGEGGDEDEERKAKIREAEEAAHRAEEERVIARAERRRAERAAAKNEEYKSRNINPNPAAQSLNNPVEGMDVGRLIQLQYHRSVSPAFSKDKEFSREIEWMESVDSDLFVPPMGGGGFVIPFEALSAVTPRSEEKGKRRGSRQVYKRAVTQDNASGGATMETMVDVANSMAWLYDSAPVMSYFVMDPGRTSRVVEYYGTNTAKPQPEWPGDGGAFTDRNPGLTRIELGPVPLGVTYELSGGLMKGSALAVSTVFQRGAEDLIGEELVKGVLSGKNVGAAGANVDEAIVGIINSGAASTGYGANAAAFTRDDIIASIDRMVASKAMGGDEVWLMSPGFATLAATRRIGGTESVRFVFERENIREGMIEGTPALVSTNVQKTGVVNPAIHVFGSRVIVPIWGSGIEVRVFSPPNKDVVQFGLHMHVNTAVINPSNADIVRQGA